MTPVVETGYDYSGEPLDGPWLLAEPPKGIRRVVLVDFDGTACSFDSYGEDSPIPSEILDSLQDAAGLVVIGLLTGDRFFAYDLLALEEFMGEEKSPLFSERLENVAAVCELAECPKITALEFRPVREVLNAPKSGVWFKKDTVFKAGRSHDTLTISWK